METYDVIVVGARAGGAATAMLLARRGLRVLLVDRDRYGSDTLSTHALMRGSVFLLTQWNLLDRIVDAGTPPVRQTLFDYGAGPPGGADRTTVSIKPTHGVQALYAPRRTVLDSVLVDAAVAAGAEVRYGVNVTGLLRDRSGRVVGVTGRDRAGASVRAGSWLTVGADGTRSTVAGEVGAPLIRVGSGAGAVVFGYWSELPVEGYEWYYRVGHTAGMIPTNGGEVCVFAGVPASTGAIRGNPHQTYHRLLADATGTADAGKGLGGRLAEARPPRRLRTWVGRPSFIRRAHGAGWALVGDAASFLDPLSTYGITNALRDAHMLASSVAVDDDIDSALCRYAEERDMLVGALFDVVDQIAGYGWDVAGVPGLLRQLSAVMGDELERISAPAASTWLVSDTVRAE